VEDDPVDPLGPFQPEVRPGAAAVDGAVTPLPTDMELRGFPSPVPTQTMSGLGWKTATAPIAATGCSSKIGVKVSAPSVDFQTPPVDAPT
jgi:hypothetical protein